MALTIGNWIFIGIVALVGFGFAIALMFDDAKVGSLATGIITVILCVALIFGLSWWHNNTANGQRAMKDFVSNIEGGLNREITITAEDGREIFHYEGKVDVETKHEGSANYILFESEEGLRYIIYYGITDTVLIVEKAG
jgi:hypothetical protein